MPFETYVQISVFFILYYRSNYSCVKLGDQENCTHLCFSHFRFFFDCAIVPINRIVCSFLFFESSLFFWSYFYRV